MQTETRPYTREDLITDLCKLEDTAAETASLYKVHEEVAPKCDIVACTDHWSGRDWQRVSKYKSILIAAIAYRACPQ